MQIMGRAIAGRAIAGRGAEGRVRRWPPTVASATAAALAALAAGHALAAPAARAGLATRAEWHACMDDADSLTKANASLKKIFDEHAAELLRWQAAMRAHVATESRVDTADAAAVEAYNAQIEAFNARGAVLNGRGDELQKAQDAFNARNLAVNQRCAGLIITRADREAVLRERAARAKAP